MLIQPWYPNRTKPTMDLVRACYANKIQLAFKYCEAKTRSRNVNYSFRCNGKLIQVSVDYTNLFVSSIEIPHYNAIVTQQILAPYNHTARLTVGVLEPS